MAHTILNEASDNNTDGRPTAKEHRDAPPFTPLVADIITASFAMTRDVTDRLVESLQRSLADREAQLDAIRAGVSELLDGPFMPTPATLRRALYPTDEQIDAFREGES